MKWHWSKAVLATHTPFLWVFAFWGWTPKSIVIYVLLTLILCLIVYRFQFYENE